MNRSIPALAALLAVGGALAGFPAAAQGQQAAQARTLTITAEERAALQALEAVAVTSDRPGQDAALARARAVARSADARYALGHFQYRIAVSRQDPQLLNQAVDLMVESGVAQPAEMGPLLSAQATQAMSSGDLRTTDRILTRLVQLQPNEPGHLADHAQVKAMLGNRAEAVALMGRALSLAEAAGRPAPESWHQRALALALEANLAPQATAFARRLVAAHPTPANWRDALLAYRDVAGADAALDLDVRRLMRAAGALAGERDYLAFAEALSQAGLAGEGKAVMDEGVSRGMLETSKPAVGQLMTALTRRATAERATLARLRSQAASADARAVRVAADTHFGHGQYAEAAALYRAALEKGGEDANLINTRLGAALALAGQRAEAEAALRAVTGPRAELAAMWLEWLARRPA